MAASAIAMPRWVTSFIASFSLRMPAAPAAASSPTEWPATPAILSRRPPSVDRGEAQQRGRDDQGLGDRGIPDRVGVADGAVGAQIDPGCVGEGIEMLGEPGFGEPGVEESGGLRALSGRDDDDSHGFHPALCRAATSNEAHERIRKTLADVYISVVE